MKIHQIYQIFSFNLMWTSFFFLKKKLILSLLIFYVEWKFLTQ